MKAYLYNVCKLKIKISIAKFIANILARVSAVDIKNIKIKFNNVKILLYSSQNSFFENF